MLKQNKFKTILGIESSCDETAAAVVQKDINSINILSNIITSSHEIQSKYGGVVPEQAAREQLKTIIPVITEALRKANITPQQLDAIAVTQGPGLIGSLLVGVETAKALSLTWNKPLIGINHLIAHFYGNWTNKNPKFSIIGLLVSGGHTDLILMKDHGLYEYLGGTRDDAAGECFDKCARILNLSYPGGPNLAKLAQTGNPKSFKLPRPMIDSSDFDFSFSGLKTAVVNIVSKQKLTDQIKKDLAACIQAAIVEVLIKKTIIVAQKYNIEQIMIAGGVAANLKLRDEMEKAVKTFLPARARLYIPPPDLCTDNAVTTATAALFNPIIIDPLTLQANPNLSLSLQ